MQTFRGATIQAGTARRIGDRRCRMSTGRSRTTVQRGGQTSAFWKRRGTLRWLILVDSGIAALGGFLPVRFWTAQR